MVKSLAEALSLTDEARVVTTVDPYVIVHTNKAWSNLTGYAFTEVSQRTNAILQGPQTMGHELQRLEESVKSGKEVTVTLVNFTKEGKAFKNKVHCIPLKNRSGNVTHFCARLSEEALEGGSVPDIKPPELVPLAPRTGVKRAVCNLDELDGDHLAQGIITVKQRTLLSEALTMQDAVVVTSANYPHKIVHVSQAWCEMCGYSKEEIEGETNKVLQGPDTNLDIVSSFPQTAARGESATATVYNYKKSGERFLNRVSIQPVYNDDDDVLDHFMAILHECDPNDISDIKNTVLAEPLSAC